MRLTNRGKRALGWLVAVGVLAYLWLGSAIAYALTGVPG